MDPLSVTNNAHNICLLVASVNIISDCFMAQRDAVELSNIRFVPTDISTVECERKMRRLNLLNNLYFFV